MHTIIIIDLSYTKPFHTTKIVLCEVRYLSEHLLTDTPRMADFARMSVHIYSQRPYTLINCYLRVSQCHPRFSNLPQILSV